MSFKNKNLDLKDRRILFELEQDARQSLQQIARKVRLSKEVVFHRIKNLEKEGIIKKYLTNVDIYKLGYKFYPLLLKLRNTDKLKEEEIITFLKSHKQISWLNTCEGNWNINLTLFANSSEEVNYFLEELLSKYGDYISEKQIFTATEAHYVKGTFGINKELRKTITTKGEKKVDLEKEDRELLQILADNARISLVEISQKMNLSPKVIAYRIKRLEKNKIILGSHILADFSKLGYKYYKIWFSLKNLNSNNKSKLFTYLKSTPNIVWITKLIGKYDLSIEMEVEDVTQFRKIIDNVKLEFREIINEHESILIFEEKVLNYMPKP